MTDLFDPIKVGDHRLRNRIVLAPMTRSRTPDNVPTAMTARYYRQRATAGLLVTEGTGISPTSMGYLYVPGIWSQEQVNGWRLATDAVHEEGGVIFVQLWHVGRVSHTSVQPNNAAPVSPSSLQAVNGRAFGIRDDGTAGIVQPTTPRALELSEIKEVIEDFRRAARNAMSAGFDGVEFHGANGYLLEQFMNPLVNDRTDEYHARTIENRCRFVLEVLDAVISEIGASRTAIRFSPFGTNGDMVPYDGQAETYEYLGRELSKRKIAYAHLMDQISRGGLSGLPEQMLRRFRASFSGPLILAGSMTRESADKLIGEGIIDLAGFGAPFISNPDLPARLKNGWPLTPADPALFYGDTGERGYTDYANYQEVAT